MGQEQTLLHAALILTPHVTQASVPVSVPALHDVPSHPVGGAWEDPGSLAYGDGRRVPCPALAVKKVSLVLL